MFHLLSVFFFFFNDTATTEIYTLSLHDALPICITMMLRNYGEEWETWPARWSGLPGAGSCHEMLLGCPLSECCVTFMRSEEHTSELQSRRDLVCRLLLEKKKEKKK